MYFRLHSYLQRLVTEKHLVYSIHLNRPSLFVRFEFRFVCTFPHSATSQRSQTTRFAVFPSASWWQLSLPPTTIRHSSTFPLSPTRESTVIVWVFHTTHLFAAGQLSSFCPGWKLRATKPVQRPNAYVIFHSKAKLDHTTVSLTVPRKYWYYNA